MNIILVELLIDNFFYFTLLRRKSDSEEILPENTIFPRR